MAEEEVSQQTSHPESVDKNKIVESGGEYGVMKNRTTFKALTNFVLRVDGYVEEDEEVTGFLIRAKPKNNRAETNNKSGW